jgi:hypothetical protein
LTLNGSTLTLGPVGAGRTVTITCRPLRLTNGARIITNGNHLVLAALDARFGDNAGIVSFASENSKAAATTNGASGGKVRINVLQKFSGSLASRYPARMAATVLQVLKVVPIDKGTGVRMLSVEACFAKAVVKIVAWEARAQREPRADPMEMEATVENWFWKPLQP